MALEIARSLRKQGEVVQLLVMIDTGRPCALRSFLIRLGDSLDRARYRLGVVGELMRSHGPRRKALFSQIIRRKFGRDTAAVEEPVSKQFTALRQQYARLLVDHRPEPYDGDVTIVTSEESHRYNQYMPWEPKIKGRTTFHRLPSTHHMLVTQHVKMLADLLRFTIDEALAESPQLRQDAGPEGAHAHDLNPFPEARRTRSAAERLLLYGVAGASIMMMSMASCWISG